MTTTVREASVREVSVFGDAIAYFNEAADLLELDAGMRRILTHPSRQIIFSIPFQRDSGEFEVYTGLSRAVQLRARAGEGRHSLPSRA